MTRRAPLAALTLALLLTATVACTSDDGAASGGSESTAPADTGGQPIDVPGLDAAALEIMNKPQYANGRWGIAVSDVETGEVLIDLDADRLVEPASVTKTYSVGAAWIELDPDSTVTTPVKRTGEVTGGRLDGDLVLVAQGDLTMGGRTKPDGTVDFTNLDHNDANVLPGATLTPGDPLAGLDELAVEVAASGITEVSGDVIVDDRLWDEHELEDQPITPIVINNNLIDLTSTPSEEGQPATVEVRPVVAPWTVTTQVQTVAAGGDTRIEVSSPEDGTIVLTGTVAADSDPVLNVYAFDDPATFARTAFIEALQRAGVTVAADPVAPNPVDALPSEEEVAGLTAVAELESLPLAEEATYILKVSYNRGAETYICRLAVASGSKDCEDGFPEAARIWQGAGLDTDQVVMVDGSGLVGNLVTPASQVQLQTIMAQRPDGDRWRDALPILGEDGSLAMVQADSPARGNVWAKTGTLVTGDLFNQRIRLEAKALGGTMTSASGRQLAFAVVLSNGVMTEIEDVFLANDDVGAVAAAIQQSF
ncbi:MAG: D-alanyl-D-alanine carboxypeptidase/D-alanyl-D-alanine-endopeptidase [Acidimicrobiia bacterium]|nr:D-alanyl-D-alanine carboxypeptidase/D-alanyl-D-alanine-endopeptidase [Acidimicrobiia bacterium]